MQIEEFLEESADLLQWMDEADSELQTKDPSPADEDALEELLEKIKVWSQVVHDSAGYFSLSNSNNNAVMFSATGGSTRTK